jgi:hypothetical protein
MARTPHRPEAAGPRAAPTLEHALSGGSRHAPHQAVNDLDDICRRLSTPRTQHELADDYRAAQRHGLTIDAGSAPELTRPIPSSPWRSHHPPR